MSGLPISTELDVLNELYTDESTDVNLKNLASFLGVSARALGDGLGISESTISRNPYAPENESLKQWQNIFNLIIKIIKNADPKLEIPLTKTKMQRWLKLPRPEFNGATPLDMMLAGKARRVKNLLEQLL